MSTKNSIADYWKINNIEKRKSSIRKHISYNHTYHEKIGISRSEIKKIKENTRNNVVNGISFDPGLNSEDISGHSLIPHPLEKVNISKLLHRVDLSSILHDINVRDKVQIPPMANLESRIINPLKTDKIFDGSQLFSEIVKAKQTQKIHFCNQHPTTSLPDNQIQYLLEKTKEEKNKEKLIKILKDFAKAGVFNTDRVTIHSNLGADQQKLLQQFNHKFVEEYRKYSGGQYKKYETGLYTAAVNCLKSNDNGISDKNDKVNTEEQAHISPLDIYHQMQDISFHIRKFGIPKNNRTSPNLLDYCESGMMGIENRKSLYIIYDIFTYAGYNGLYFITPEQKENNTSKFTLFGCNPYISGSKCEIQDNKLCEEERTLLGIISTRLESIRKIIYSEIESNDFSIHNLNESLKEREWWGSNLHKKFLLEFEKYQSKFSGRAFRYILNYLGGQLTNLRKFFSNKGGEISRNKDEYSTLMLYLEIQYLLSFFRDIMRKKWIEAKNSKKKFKGFMDEALQKLTLIFWKPKGGTLKELYDKILRKLQKLELYLVTESVKTSNLEPLISTLKNAIEQGDIIYRLYTVYNNPSKFNIKKNDNARKLLYSHIFDDEELMEDLYNYYRVLAQLRFFFRSHQYNLSVDEADFAFPFELYEELSLTEKQEIQKAEITSTKVGISSDTWYHKTYKTSLSVPISMKHGSKIDSDSITSANLENLEISDLMMRQQIIRFLDPERRKIYNRRRKKKGLRSFGKNFKDFTELLQLKPPEKEDSDDVDGSTKRNKYAEYEKLFTYYKNRSIETELSKIDTRIRQLTYKRGSDHPERPSLSNIDSIPIFTDKRNPTTNEMRIQDYERLAAESVKRMGRHSNTICITEITNPKLDTNKKKRRSTIEKELEDRTDEKFQYGHRLEGSVGIEYYAKKNEKSIQNNPSQYESRSAYEFINNALNATHTLKSKLKYTKKVLSSIEFEDAKKILMYSSYVPRKLLTIMMNGWKTDRQWTYGTICSWRRKIDSNLHKKLRINDLSSLFIPLAKEILSFLPNENQEFGKERKLVGWFQKNHALHLLLSEENLWYAVSTRTKARFEEQNYINLKSKLNENSIKIPPDLQSRITKFENDEIIDAADKFLEFLQSQKPYSANKVSEETGNDKILGIKECVKKFTQKQWVSQFSYIWKNCIPGLKYTRFLKRILQTHSDLDKRYIIDALFGVLGFAYANRYSKDEKQFASHFTNKNCITLPFQSEKRRKSIMPLQLIGFNNGIVNLIDPNESRTARSNQMTYQKMREVWLSNFPAIIGIQLITDDMVTDSNGNLLVTRKKGKPTERKEDPYPYLFFELYPTEKMLECIRRGAEIETMRMLPPQGPSRKLEVDVILKAPIKQVFQHGHKFIEKWDEKYPDLKDKLEKIGKKRMDILGTDFNKLSRYILAVSTPDKQIDLTHRLQKWDEINDRLELLRTRVIPKLQKKIAKLKKIYPVTENSSGYQSKIGKYRAELVLIYRKRKNLMIEFKRQAIMLLIYIITKLQPDKVGWDGINIPTKRKSGKFAATITYLPQNQNLLRLAEEWIRDLQDTKKPRGGFYLSHSTKIVPTNPHTGRYCPDCLNEVVNTRGNIKDAATKKRGKEILYRDFVCKKCDYKNIGGRDSTAAQVCAIFVKHPDVINEKSLI